MPTDRQLRRMTEERTVVIQEVDMTKNYISMKDQYNTLLQASVDFTSPIVVIPKTGETWIAERRNTSWYLKRRGSANANNQSLAPGTTLISGDTIEIDGTLNINGEAYETPTAPVYQVPYAIYATTGASIPNNVFTNINMASFDTTDHDIFSWSSGSPSLCTVATGGLYHAAISLGTASTWPSSSTIFAQANFAGYGLGFGGGNVLPINNTFFPSSRITQFTPFWNLPAGANLQIAVTQTTGSSYTLSSINVLIMRMNPTNLTASGMPI